MTDKQKQQDKDLAAQRQEIAKKRKIEADELEKQRQVKAREWEANRIKNTKANNPFDTMSISGTPEERKQAGLPPIPPPDAEMKPVESDLRDPFIENTAEVKAQENVVKSMPKQDLTADPLETNKNLKPNPAADFDAKVQVEKAKILEGNKPEVKPTVAHPVKK